MEKNDYLVMLADEELIAIANKYFHFNDEEKPPWINRIGSLCVVKNMAGEKLAIYPFSAHYKSAGGMQVPDYQTKQDAFLDFMVTKFGKEYLKDMYYNKLNVAEKYEEYLASQNAAEEQADTAYRNYKIKHGLVLPEELVIQKYLTDQALWFQLYETFCTKKPLSSEKMFEHINGYKFSADEMHEEVLYLMEDIINEQGVTVEHIVEQTQNSAFAQYGQELLSKEEQEKED